jgi:DNA adenine methylase
MVEPFLRWAGGKRWLARRIAPLLRARLDESASYFEPFLGGGALFFALKPKRAVLSDLNADLIATYVTVAWRHGMVTEYLKQLKASKQEYKRIREWKPIAPIERAVRLIYLNRNCYGGLYRENKKGHFNVPYGGGERDHLTLCKKGLLQHAARALRSSSSIELRVSDFGRVILRAGEGDVVYCDPTYREVTRAHFDRYGKNVFDWKDQERLAKRANAAYERGALVLLSNGASSRLRQLYPSAAAIKVVRRKGLGKDGGRHLRKEYLFVLDPNEDWNHWKPLGRISKP